MARPQWCALPQASMATMQRGCSAKKPRTFSRESFLRKPTLPSARAPCAWKDRFARSRPIMLILSMDALSVRGMRKHHHLGTSRCRQEGHPLHHSIVDAALLVGRAPSGFYEEVRRGRLPVSRWRGRMLVHHDEIARWLTPDPAEPEPQT